MSEAGSVVKDRAASVAQDLSQKALRVCLDIKMKAPIIIVPQNSRSRNAVVLDLGNLVVSNSFMSAGKRDSKGLPAVLDRMVLELTLLKIYRSVRSTLSSNPCTFIHFVTQ